MDECIYAVSQGRLYKFTPILEEVGATDLPEPTLHPSVFAWTKSCEAVGILCESVLLVYDANLTLLLSFPFEILSPMSVPRLVLSTTKTKNLIYVPGRILLFEGVNLLCSVDEFCSFQQGVLSGHIAQSGFVIFGSKSLDDLVMVFYFDDKGKLKGIYPNLIPSEEPKWASFIDEDERVVVADGGGRITCLSLKPV